MSLPDLLAWRVQMDKHTCYVNKKKISDILDFLIKKQTKTQQQKRRKKKKRKKKKMQ